MADTVTVELYSTSVISAREVISTAGGALAWARLCLQRQLGTHRPGASRLPRREEAIRRKFAWALSHLAGHYWPLKSSVAAGRSRQRGPCWKVPAGGRAGCQEGAAVSPPAQMNVRSIDLIADSGGNRIQERES